MKHVLFVLFTLIVWVIQTTLLICRLLGHIETDNWLMPWVHVVIATACLIYACAEAKINRR